MFHDETTTTNNTAVNLINIRNVQSKFKNTIFVY